MNIIEQIDRVKFWCDRVKSARWSNQRHLVASLNIATDHFHEVLSAEFEQSKIIKASLQPLVVQDAPLSVSGQFIVALPANFHSEISLNLIIAGNRRWSNPKQSISRTKINQNTFRAPSDAYPVHYTFDGGLRVETGGTLPSSALLTYIAKPTKMVWNETPIVAGPAVLTIGQTYYVVTAAVHNAVSYAVGDTFVAITTVLTSGSVYFIVNCPLADPSHEDVAKYAASVLTGTIEDFDKSLILGKDFKK